MAVGFPSGFPDGRSPSGGRVKSVGPTLSHCSAAGRQGPEVSVPGQSSLSGLNISRGHRELLKMKACAKLSQRALPYTHWETLGQSLNLPRPRSAGLYHVGSTLFDLGGSSDSVLLLTEVLEASTRSYIVWEAMGKGKGWGAPSENDPIIHSGISSSTT